MTPAYLQTIQNLIADNVVPDNEIYQVPVQHRLEQYYDSFYDFANAHLQDKRPILNFPPSYLFFRDDFSVNAFAQSTQNYKLIGIHYGCFEQMYDFFEAQAAVFQQAEYTSIRILADKIGITTHFLLFQCFSLFIYYHEYAHLVQRTVDSAFQLDEAVQGAIPQNQVLQSHAYELDADWLGVSNLAIHLAQNLKDEQGNYIGSVEEISDLASIALAAIFCFFIKAAGHYQGLYYMENRHPHPFIRISYIVTFLLTGLQGNVPEELVLNQPQILQKGILIAEAILQQDVDNPIGELGHQILANGDGIEAHVNAIINFAVDDPMLCRNRNLDEI